jgi:S-adenosylmethionine synthetase
LAKRCKIQVSYAIGIAQPLSIHVDTYGTGIMSDDKIAAIVGKVFDLRPAAIIENLKLKRPIYRETARNGHFGRNLPNFTWEKLDKVAQIKKEAGI